MLRERNGWHHAQQEPVDNPYHTVEQFIHQVKDKTPRIHFHGGVGSYHYPNGKPIKDWDKLLGRDKATRTEEGVTVYHEHGGKAEIKLNNGEIIELGRDRKGIEGAAIVHEIRSTPRR